MYPVVIQMISAERGRQMREQAAAWRRARLTLEPFFDRHPEAFPADAAVPPRQRFASPSAANS